MDGLLQDVRYALRQLRKSPAFAAVAVLTLALGIGANTAMFSVLNAVLLKGLPVTDPHRLYYLQIGQGQGQPDGASQTGNALNTFSLPVYAALRTRTDVMESVVAFVPLSFNRTPVRVGSTPEEVWADEVSGNFFSGLSARLALGRGFTREDEDRHAAVAVIGYGYWTSRFNRDPGVLGKTIFVKGVPFTVIGVAGARFAGLESGTVTDVWIPLQSDLKLNAWGAPGTQETLYSTPNWWALQMVARLRPGVTPEQASEALRGSFAAAARTGLKSGSLGNWKAVLDFEEAKGIAGYSASYREPMQVLMGLMLLVLLIACTNVATMLLARNAVRQREFSLRLAMGATQRRLLAQLLAESALLVSAGALLGWGLAEYATGWLARMAAIETGLRPDGHVLLFTLGLSVAVGGVFGLAPLWSAVRAPVSDVLRTGATNLSLDRRRVWNGRLVMAGQIALGLMLLTASGLLLRTLDNYRREQLGMQADRLLVFGVTPQGVEGKVATAAFYRTLVDRLRALPGVREVTLAENRPGSGWSDNNDITLDGVHQDGVTVRSNSVGGGFFRTLGVPVLEGREIEERDATGPTVAVVNESFAKRFFPRSSPLGHHTGTKYPMTIVGVVADSKYTGVDEDPRPMMYYPALASPDVGTLQVEIGVAGDPMALLPEVRRTVSAINPNIPLQQPMTQAAQFEASYAQPRMVGELGGFFGVLAAVLVATGLYGTMSYRTNRRSLEIGVRMAVGAQRGQVLWLIFRESLLVLVVGVAAAAPLAYFGLHLLGSMLYRMSAFDPRVLVTAVGCVAMVVVLASLLPARRAASIEPVRALRAD